MKLYLNLPCPCSALMKNSFSMSATVGSLMISLSTLSSSISGSLTPSFSGSHPSIIKSASSSISSSKLLARFSGIVPPWKGFCRLFVFSRYQHSATPKCHRSADARRGIPGGSFCGAIRNQLPAV